MRTLPLSGLAGSAMILGLLCGASPAAAATAGPATTAAPGLSIELPEDAGLLAGGAGTSITVTFQCTAGESYNMFVELAQVVEEGRTATGTGFTGPGTCTGSSQTEDLLVVAGGGFYAFREGEAVARASVSVCPNGQTCGQAMDAGVLELREALPN
ncbi:hypothetical protein [Arthrobacter mobilis]|uniref:Uncharacterized protein n=1 Tax=Arthrobacter mobilis TaxID=2724944 RepID=A0A7X6HBK0_9MICC|nr:hypothetical protein [Arthrobacter mobilis]NKX53339.1 hypothetical protein [Arthrobacter mobilis]